jgi:hypothetical protein
VSDLLPTYRLGYAINNEDREYLDDTGVDLHQAMKAYRETFPVFNPIADPLGAVDILNQRNQGACQGHALATIFSICYFLATGRKQAFSRACGYYVSQAFDGIRGDNGSTLSAGQKVATQHGMCLESDWPYPDRYNPTKPTGIAYPYKLVATKPIRTMADFVAWTDLNLPVQDGFAWNDTCSREIVNAYQPLRGSGGHSTDYWLKTPQGNFRKINSWGEEWCGDGCNEWTPKSVERVLADSMTTMIGYAPDGMSFPDAKPIEL